MAYKNRSRPKGKRKKSNVPAPSVKTMAEATRRNNRTRRAGKILLYLYNGEADSEGQKFDMAGEETIPAEGSFVERKGKEWKVFRIETVSGTGDVPLHKIYLVDTF